MGESISASTRVASRRGISLLSLSSRVRSFSRRRLLRDRSHDNESSRRFPQLCLHSAGRSRSHNSHAGSYDRGFVSEKSLRPGHKGTQQFKRSRSRVRVELQRSSGFSSSLYTNQHRRREQLPDSGNQYSQ